MLPAASCGVSVKQAELLDVQLLIILLLALLLDIAADCIFASASPNRADVVAIRPKLAAPQLLFNTRYLLENLTRGDALDDLDYLRRTVLGTDWTRKCT